MLASVISASLHGGRLQRTSGISSIPSKIRDNPSLHDNRLTMDPFFPHYLLSKQTVDDRALNKDVLNALRVHLSPQPVSIIEVGGGIGTMLKRLIQWGILCNADYILVDALAANIVYAREWIPQWAVEAGLSVERFG